MKEVVNINISQEKQPVNTGQPVVFPGLKGLAGGKKQHWINANLDLISLLNDNIGFEYTRKALNMKADTLEKALQKAERQHRPAVTKAERAMNRTLVVESKLNEIIPELERQAVELSEHVADDIDLRKNLSDFFRLQASANSMMAEIVQRQGYTSPDLTYHIISPNGHKVGPTAENQQLNRRRSQTCYTLPKVP